MRDDPAVEPMLISGAWKFMPRRFDDQRGTFLVPFQQDLMRATVGHEIEVGQVNCAISAAGVIRGIHFTGTPPGQAKYVTCLAGEVLDVVVDLRVGSPTFGRWDSAVLQGVGRSAVYLSEGLGHAVMSLTEKSVIAYLCSTQYAPEREHAITPLDPRLGIDWPAKGPAGTILRICLSDRDAAAPTLTTAYEQGILPAFV
ncbi:dTDP-4-dehydrorhamnose 3,5-epimerase family protein [Kribbella solani]|uniref:dTDP-4-dehydrorhamnose 3,5-epimerase n=1 Tax=Kribbella solani TaxID=236067 RepID=A0A841E1J9_9ACTN|nr:dTDP-4-dehydrorhamnose 3,5-epimerase [Kribbella solani]MBB5982896.1 dTDP-4-dehydrorhamnose 3,5-epimerase [Kribbella solani]